MTKTLLASSLLILLSSTAYADVPAQAVTPIAPNPASVANTTPLPVMDCHFRLPATTDATPLIVSSWAEKAAVQSFDFGYDNVDARFAELKLCFTDQGWQGFNSALTQSGNLTAVKSQKLTVSSQVDGKSSIETMKANQWKVTVPLQVVYQNDKEKLTQVLFINLLITRKVSGDLGILQMIAAPRNKAPAVTQSKP